MLQRRLLYLTVGFSAGIILGHSFQFNAGVWLLLIAAALLATGLFFMCRGRIHTAAILLCAILAGAFWYDLSLYPQRIYYDLSGSLVEGKGIVISYPKQTAFSLSFLIKAEELTAGERKLIGLEKLQVVVRGGDGNLFLPGTRIIYRGELVLPSEPRNPGQFDYRKYLANQQVFYQLELSPKDVLTEEGRGIRSLAARGRARVARFSQENLPERESGLLLGLLFGDVSGITESDWENYQRAGVLHLFAVSGFNVVFVLGVAYFLLSFLGTGPLQRLLWGIPVLLGYYYLVGWTASIVRASLMALAGLAALLFGRRQDIYTSLALAALIILLVNPGELFLASFQLSFLATAGIVYLTPYLVGQGFGRVLAPTLAAQLATFPVVVYYFNLVSLAAPLLNVFAVVISGLVTVLGFLGTLLTWIAPCLASPLFLCSGFLLFILSEVILRAAAFEWSALIVSQPSLLLIASYYVFLALLPHISRLLPYLRYLGVRFKYPLAVVLVLAVFLSSFGSAGVMEVTFLDVGQGDSIFIQTPGGNTVLIDGGGTPGYDYEVGKKTIKPFLQRRGLERIDVMIMSHNHLDHSEGLMELIPLLKVGCFLMPPPEENNPTEAELLNLCRLEGIMVRSLTAGERIILDEGVVLEVVHPQRGDKSWGNNHSLVLRLVYRNTGWLLTGDIEKEAIEKILAGGADIRADVLKLPHHGSIDSFSPEFYRAVNPQEAVISVGSNLFGQPHAQVVGYFAQNGIPLHITRERGAVMTTSNGQKVKMQTMQKAHAQ